MIQLGLLFETVIFTITASFVIDSVNVILSCRVGIVVWLTNDE